MLNTVGESLILTCWLCLMHPKRQFVLWLPGTLLAHTELLSPSPPHLFLLSFPADSFLLSNHMPPILCLWWHCSALDAEPSIFLHDTADCPVLQTIQNLLQSLLSHPTSQQHFSIQCHRFAEDALHTCKTDKNVEQKNYSLFNLLASVK